MEKFTNKGLGRIYDQLIELPHFFVDSSERPRESPADTEPGGGKPGLLGRRPARDTCPSSSVLLLLEEGERTESKIRERTAESGRLFPVASFKEKVVKSRRPLRCPRRPAPWSWLPFWGRRGRFGPAAPSRSGPWRAAAIRPGLGRLRVVNPCGQCARFRPRWSLQQCQPGEGTLR